MRRAFGLVLMAAVLAGCSGSGMDAPPDVTVTYIPSPVDNGYGASNVSWVGEWIVFDEADSASGTIQIYNYRMWRVRPDGTGMEQLPLNYDGTNCGNETPFVSFTDPMRFSDTELLYVQDCVPTSPDNPALPSNTRNAKMKVVNLDTLAVMPEYSMVFDEVPIFGNRGIALNVAESWAMTTTGRHDYGIIRQLIRRFSVDERAGKVVQRFELPVFQVWGLALSRDSTRVAFVGRDGDRREPPGTTVGQLYTATPEFASVRPLGEKMQGLFGSSWSPDGRWILVSGKRDGTRGLWIVHSETGETRLVAKGWYGMNPTAWSPDGTHVAVRKSEGDQLNAPPTVIAVFDLTALLVEP